LLQLEKETGQTYSYYGVLIGSYRLNAYLTRLHQLIIKDTDCSHCGSLHGTKK